ncbi:iron complex transport system ATP-binding protein [Leucobacter komagatae]|uniref:Iron complex transport system ATP-binding protein n=1 Tax=Leucobacter komagatae TaxID=55969 RepID=A0A542XYG6_9MICO|nr:ABC transporter ATP-binding protein [Leucobacter komagatae]TQL40861.1 iron complex transport system ATP-binding protein [Leucobacter komagatae]
MTPALPALRADGLSVEYSKHAVLSDLELEIPTGQITTLVGPNGSGKSTLLKALARIQPLSTGSVTLNGSDIHRMKTREVARSLGILPQSPLAPEGITVADLVRRGRHPHGRSLGRGAAGDTDAVAQALDVTGTAEFAGRPVDSLSGGQRQRVWIAMVLAQTTPILLLDEPTTFLDIAHQIEVLELLASLKHDHGKTVLLVLHDLEQAAAYSDRIVALKAGEIAAVGPPNDVVTESFVADVFGLASRVIHDPDTGAPLILPRGRARPGPATAPNPL